MPELPSIFPSVLLLLSFSITAIPFFIAVLKERVGQIDISFSFGPLGCIKRMARMRFSPATKNITKLMDIKSLKLLDHFASFNPSPSLHWTISRVWSKCYGV
ncbi:unnamed protein product [Lepeophtheirus salmonis]|uniref:(salmon louse) hypothetical protein n=1 Tax=Lepeophtheirus salmonis TaxID=72036 RepID=A0A7R8GZP2_LEPSM|nr:unnamed protein product [Lepeophtheirus salmonis]CAF2770320.1 unnamed protein product [Lepeophtheirus salmonis]